MDQQAVKELKKRYRADAIALAEEKYNIGYKNGLAKGRKASKDSQIQLRAAIEAIGSMRKRYKKEALKRCDEMFAEGFEKGLEQGLEQNVHSNNNSNNTNDNVDHTKIIHITLDQTYNMLKHNFQSKNNNASWDSDEILNILKSTMRDVAKKVKKRKSFISSVQSDHYNNNERGHDAEKNKKIIQNLQHELNKVSFKHEKDQMKIQKLEKEIEKNKELIYNYYHQRERAQSNTSPITVTSSQNNSTIDKSNNDNNMKKKKKASTPTVSSTNNNNMTNNNSTTNIRHVTFTPSTAPIRLDVRELNLPPLWLELVHAHLNATSKVAIPWRVSVYKPRRMDSDANASSPFMAYDVLSNIVDDENGHANNIIDGEYVPWYATIPQKDIELWKKDKSNLRPVVHRRFKEFEWLYYRLKQQFSGSIVPLLPPKRYSFMESKFNIEFIESRKNALNQWLIYIASHPLLSTSLDLRSFLSTNFSMDSPLSADNIMLKTKSTLTNEHNKLSTDSSIRNLLNGYKFPRSLETEAEKAGTKAFDASSTSEHIGTLIGNLGNEMKKLGSNVDHCNQIATPKQSASPSAPSSKTKKSSSSSSTTTPEPSGGIFWEMVGNHYRDNIKPIYDQRTNVFSSISNLYLFWGTQLLPEVRKSFDVPLRESTWHDKLGVAGRTGAELRELQKQYKHIVSKELGKFAKEMKTNARKERKEWESILKQLEETPTPTIQKKYYDGIQPTFIPPSSASFKTTTTDTNHTNNKHKRQKSRTSTKSAKTPPRKSSTTAHSHTRASSSKAKSNFYGLDDNDNVDDLEDFFTKAKEEETAEQREENKKIKEEALRRKRERGAKLRARKREQADAERAAKMKQREEEGAKKREELKRQMVREREEKEKSLARSRRESLKQKEIATERKLEEERKRKESRRRKYEEKMKHGLFANDQDETTFRPNNYNPGIFTNLYSGKEKRPAAQTFSAAATANANATNKNKPKRNSDKNNNKAKSQANASYKKSSYKNTTSAKDKSWDGDNWLEATTKDGRIYYYHRNTRIVRWDKPPPHIAKQMDERKKREEMVAEKRRKERLDALRKSEEDKKEYNDFKIQISAKVQKRVQNWSRVSDHGKKLKSLFNLLNTIHLDMPELVLKPLPGARKVVKQNLDDDPFGYNSNMNNNIPDAKTLKKMYRVALLKIHPDRIGKNVSVEVRLLAEQVFGVINKQAKESGL